MAYKSPLDPNLNIHDDGDDDSVLSASRLYLSGEEPDPDEQSVCEAEDMIWRRKETFPQMPSTEKELLKELARQRDAFPDFQARVRRLGGEIYAPRTERKRWQMQAQPLPFDARPLQPKGSVSRRFALIEEIKRLREYYGTRAVPLPTYLSILRMLIEAAANLHLTPHLIERLRACTGRGGAGGGGGAAVAPEPGDQQRVIERGESDRGIFSPEQAEALCLWRLELAAGHAEWRHILESIDQTFDYAGKPIATSPVGNCQGSRPPEAVLEALHLVASFGMTKRAAQIFETGCCYKSFKGWIVRALTSPEKAVSRELPLDEIWDSIYEGLYAPVPAMGNVVASDTNREV